MTQSIKEGKMGDPSPFFRKDSLKKKGGIVGHLYIYIYGIRPICRLHFGQNFQSFPSVIVKNGPEKNGLKNVPKMHVLLSLNLLLFPRKG